MVDLNLLVYLEEGDRWGFIQNSDQAVVLTGSSIATPEYLEAIALACRQYKPLVLALYDVMQQWAAADTNVRSSDSLWLHANNLLEGTEWIHAENKAEKREEWKREVAADRTSQSFFEWRKK